MSADETKLKISCFILLFTSSRLPSSRFTVVALGVLLHSFLSKRKRKKKHVSTSASDSHFHSSTFVTEYKQNSTYFCFFYQNASRSPVGDYFLQACTDCRVSLILQSLHWIIVWFVAVLLPTQSSFLAFSPSVSWDTSLADSTAYICRHKH